MIVSVGGKPGEGFAAVVSAAERIHVSAGGFAVRSWLVVIQVAPVGGHGAGGESAAAGPDVDGCGEPGGGAAAEFGDVEEPAAVVGEQPGKQDFVPGYPG